MSKQFLLHDEARAAILRGMNTAADIVGSTLGPLGGTVVLGRPAGYGPAKVTKDGVSTAAELELPDPWENEGAKLICEWTDSTQTCKEKPATVILFQPKKPTRFLHTFCGCAICSGRARGHCRRRFA